MLNIRSTPRAIVADPISMSVSGIDKSFGATRVLDGVSLDVQTGETVALLGPSGCGKTTLLRIITGLETADAGTVTLGDEVVVGPGRFTPPERRRIGLVFQDWALFPHMTVGANVGYGLDRAQIRDGRIEESLELVGLGGLADRMPSTLSGGQQQRVALARALAPRPRAILLDEPFSNLDTSLRVQVRTEVHRLLAELGITTIFVTHDQDEAFVLGDRVAVMNGGVIEQLATPAELYRTPASRWVADFVGEANFVPGDGHGDHADTPFGQVELAHPQRGPVDVLIRPEDLRLVTGDDLQVELVEYYGHDHVVLLADRQGRLLRARGMGAPHVERGQAVSVRCEGARSVGFSRA
jgi:iron(III) transport system ATP-binding protein